MSAEPGGQRGRAVDGDDQQGGADRGGHLEAEGEDERGDDDESAADAEEAGEQADSVAAATILRPWRGVAPLPRRRQPLVPACGRAAGVGLSSVGVFVPPRDTEAAPPSGRPVGSGSPDTTAPVPAASALLAAAGRRRRSMTAAATSMRAANRVSSRPGFDAGGQPGAGVGAGHTEDAERDAWRDAYPACALMGSHAGERGDPDDEQRSGGGGARRLMQQVDQGRDRMDPPPPIAPSDRPISSPAGIAMASMRGPPSRCIPPWVFVRLRRGYLPFERYGKYLGGYAKVAKVPSRGSREPDESRDGLAELGPAKPARLSQV